MSEDERTTGTGPKNESLFPGKPQYLYRYCDADRALQILRDHAMYLVPPCKMNDLIEGTPARLTHYSESSAHELEVRRSMKEGLTRNEATEFVNESVSVQAQKENFEYFVGELQKFAAALREHAGLVCMSAAFNHQKMWGNYAANHSGVCIQFWRDGGDSVVHKHALPVEYTSEDLTKGLVEGLDENGGASIKLLGDLLLLKKTPEWSSEEEWRIVMLDNKPVPEEERLFRFPASNVRRVFLGPRTSEGLRRSFHLLSREQQLIWTVFEVRVDSITGVSSFHGIELNRSIEDFEWHSSLNLPSKTK